MEKNISKDTKIKLIALIVVIVVALTAGGVSIWYFASQNTQERTSGDFTISIVKNKAYITGYGGADVSVSVPSRLGGKAVAGVKKGAFTGNKITNIEFSSAISSLTLEAECFKDLTALTYVQLPPTVEAIPDEAFSGCYALTHILLPSSVKTIGKSAFEGCNKLEYVGSENNGFELPAQLESIGENAFKSCVKITTLKIGEALTILGKGAFESCTGLKTLTFTGADNIKTLGERAFYKTTLYSHVNTPLTFPVLESIGKEALGGMSSNFSYFKIPASVKNVSERAFADNISLTQVEFADGVEFTNFGEAVFEDCTYLDNIVLPSSMTKVPSRTFSGCFRLLRSNDFTIGKNVTEIGDGAFSILDSASSSRFSYVNRGIKVAPENKDFKSVELPDYYKNSSAKKHGMLTSADGKTLIAYFGGYDSASARDDKENTVAKAFKYLLDDLEVDTIGAYAFAGAGFGKLCLNGGITSIGDYAFNSSDISAVYFDGADCKFSSDTFAGIDAGFEFLVTDLGGTVEEQLNENSWGVGFNKFSGWPE